MSAFWLDAMRSFVITVFILSRHVSSLLCPSHSDFRQHFLWDFGCSDPYAAVGYDVLHRVDVGIFGHHLWPLLLDAVDALKCARVVDLNFSMLPRWPGLDHFNGSTRRATEIDFSDGNTFVSLLEVCTFLFRR